MSNFKAVMSKSKLDKALRQLSPNMASAVEFRAFSGTKTNGKPEVRFGGLYVGPEMMTDFKNDTSDFQVTQLFKGTIYASSTNPKRLLLVTEGSLTKLKELGKECIGQHKLKYVLVTMKPGDLEPLPTKEEMAELNDHDPEKGDFQPLEVESHYDAKQECEALAKQVLPRMLLTIKTRHEKYHHQLRGAEAIFQKAYASHDFSAAMGALKLLSGLIDKVNKASVDRAMPDIDDDADGMGFLKGAENRFKERIKALERVMLAFDSAVDKGAYAQQPGRELTLAVDTYQDAKRDLAAAVAQARFVVANNLLDALEVAIERLRTASENAAGNDEQAVTRFKELLENAPKIDYFKRLKHYHTRIKAVQNWKSNGRFDRADPPIDGKLEEFQKKFDLVEQLHDRENYAEATHNLDRLMAVVAELEAERRKLLKERIDEATDPSEATADGVAKLVMKLSENDVAVLDPAQQISLLKTLRENAPQACSKCNLLWTLDGCSDKLCSGGTSVLQIITHRHAPTLAAARDKLYKHIALQDAFVQKDRELRGKILQALAIGEPKRRYEEAQENWSSWDQAERFKFLNYAVEVQSDIMGHPKPLVVPGTGKDATPRTCSGSVYLCTTCNISCPSCGNRWLAGYNGNGSPSDLTCPNCFRQGKYVSKAAEFRRKWSIRVGVNCPECGLPSIVKRQICGAVWPGPTEKGTCSACRAENTGTLVKFGGCDFSILQGAPQSVIKLNPSENVCGDFQQLFNTIMHENVHSFQQTLVKQYRDGNTDKLEELLGINSQTPPGVKKGLLDQVSLFSENCYGYAQDGDGSGYRKQPLEEHAWKFGNKMMAKAEAQRKGLKRAAGPVVDVPKEAEFNL
jgi:hypothetical protein